MKLLLVDNSYPHIYVHTTHPSIILCSAFIVDFEFAAHECFALAFAHFLIRTNAGLWFVLTAANTTNTKQNWSAFQKVQNLSIYCTFYCDHFASISPVMTRT